MEKAYFHPNSELRFYGFKRQNQQHKINVVTKSVPGFILLLNDNSESNSMTPFKEVNAPAEIGNVGKKLPPTE